MNPVSTQASMGTQAAPSALHSDNLQQHEQVLLRLLTCIKDQYSTFITTEQAKQIDAVVDSFVSEGQKAEKDQYGGIGNHILANLTEEPTITPGGMVSLEQPYFASEAIDLPELELLTPSRQRVKCNPLPNLGADYDEGSHSASTQEIAYVGGTTNTRKRKRAEEYVPLVHTTKKPTGSVLSLNSSLYKSNGTGKTPQSAASMSSQNEKRTIHLKPRDPRRALFRNVAAAASEPNKVNGVTAGRHGTTTTGRGKRAPADDASTTAVADGNNIPCKAREVDAKPTPKTVPAVASQESAKGDVDRLLDGRILELRAAMQRDRARRLVEQNRMFASRKLSLVLDLDHTLVNSTKFVDVDPLHEELLRRKEKQDRGKPRRHLFRLRHMGLWTKLRPGIWNFLEKANELFELHICTMGNTAYAAEIAKLLDPTGCLFAGRVRSRRDDGDGMVSQRKDLSGVLGLECAAVIIDDTPSVWPRRQPNLIAVERYHFFPSSRRKFGLTGPSLLEMERDEREEDGALASSLEIIRRIHDDFFMRHSDGDVRKLLLTKPKD